MKQPRMYNTLADLKAAYERGELSRETTRLYIDNDRTFVYTAGENGEKVFDLHPASLLDQALTLLGIPWDNV